MGQSVSEIVFAAIDIGSHTTRMLLAQVKGVQVTPVCSERRVTRLAEGFTHSGIITERAQHRNILALKEYLAILEKFQVKGIFCGATGVVRRAKNSCAVAGRISSETGIECSVISEEAEAVLSAKGILSMLPMPTSNLFTFDVGGGSTEVVLIRKGTPVENASRPIGAATLTEAFLKADPPGAAALNMARLSAEKEILSVKQELYASLEKTGTIPIFAALPFVGTAGTVSTLAAMYVNMEHYVPYRVNALELTKGWLDRTIESLARMSLAHRRLLTGLEPGREDIILGGSVIVSQVLSCFDRKSFVVSDAGLLEGLLIDLIEKKWGFFSGEPAGLSAGLTWRLQNEQGPVM